MTWKVAHVRPIGFSFGTKFRRHKLFSRIGVVNVTAGNNQASSSVETRLATQVFKRSRVPNESATRRVPVDHSFADCQLEDRSYPEAQVIQYVATHRTCRAVQDCLKAVAIYAM